MNKEYLKRINIILDKNQEILLESYEKAFLEENSKINLISKNDEKYLFEKHIFDSLSINLFLENSNKEIKLLDIGTGGGFPAIPIAILYKNFQIYPLDSIKKKINAITNIKNKLKLTNIKPICERAENINDEFDIVTSRAVSKLDKIIKLSANKLKKDGYLIVYKSIKAEEELQEAKNSIKKYGLKFYKKIEYELPLEQKFTRYLIILRKVK